MSNTGVSRCLARDTPTGTSGLLGNTAGLQAFCLLRTGPYAWHQDTLQIDGFRHGPRHRLPGAKRVRERTAANEQLPVRNSFSPGLAASALATRRRIASPRW